jgi:hypothetical protein
VLIPGVVSLARNSSGPLYNGVTESSADTFTGVSPKDTMWAFGALSNFATLHYVTFGSLRGAPAGFDLSSVLLPNKPMVVHLTNEDVYLQVTFLTWVHGPHVGSGFSYTRSTPAVVPPSVTITNPPGGAVFAAPANVKIAANATVSGGSVTNVAFFGNSSNLLGSAKTAPFSITASNLAAGGYALTAVATAAGSSATSSVVQISVVSPVDVVLSGAAVVGGQFTFDYTVNPGLTYALQKSSNLVDWQSSTNTPVASPVHVSDPVAPDDWRFYRVQRLPNP